VTSRRIAARYAEALFGIAGERGAVDALRVELGELVKVVQSSPELTGLLERPDIGAERKLQVVQAALSSRFSEAIMSLVAALVRHRRGDHIPEVAAAFDEMADDAAGVVRAEATTAVPLTDDQRRRLVSVLDRITGRKVALEERVDPEILAGMMVRVGDQLVDGSAAGRLRRLREELIGMEGSKR
jgi:F-type H+-transporting ATPase subunit delta